MQNYISEIRDLVECSAEIGLLTPPSIAPHIAAPNPVAGSSAGKEIRRKALALLKRIDCELPLMPPAKALEVIDCYDLLHRIALGKPAARRILNYYTLQALQTRIKGDKTVDQFVLFSRIRTALRHKDPDFRGQPVEWYSATLSRWYREAKKLIAASPALAPALDQSSSTVHSKKRKGDIKSTFPKVETVNKDPDVERMINQLIATDLSIYEGSNEPNFKSLLTTSGNTINYKVN